MARARGRTRKSGRAGENILAENGTVFEKLLQGPALLNALGALNAGGQPRPDVRFERGIELAGHFLCQGRI